MAEPQDYILNPLLGYLTRAIERAGAELADVFGVPVAARIESGAPTTQGDASEGGAPDLVVAGAFSGAVGGPVAFVVPADAAARLAGRVRHLSEEEIAASIGQPPTEEDAAAVVFALARLGAAATAVAADVLGAELRWPSEATALTPTLTSAGAGAETILGTLGFGAEAFAVLVRFAEPANVALQIVLPADTAGRLGELAGGTASHQDAGAEQRVACGQAELARLRPVRLPVRVVVARRTMTVRELINLAPGRVVDLEKRCDELLEVCTGPKLIGRGEAVVVDDRFGFRLTHLAGNGPAEERPSHVIHSPGSPAE